MIRIAICDDEKNDINKVKTFCEQYFKEHNIQGECDIFFSGEEVLEYSRNKENEIIDLLFLDIEMGGASGIDIKDEIINSDRIWRIVYVSGYKNRVFEAFGLKIMGFVGKPADSSEIQKYIVAVMNELNEKRHFNVGGIQLDNIEMEDILYLEGKDNYTQLYLKNKDKYKNNPILISKTLRFFEINSLDYPLIRIYKSYMVNMENIESVKYKDDNGRKGIKLKGVEKVFPFGRKYEKIAREKYSKFVGKKMRNRIR